MLGPDPSDELVFQRFRLGDLGEERSGTDAIVERDEGQVVKFPALLHGLDPQLVVLEGTHRRVITVAIDPDAFAEDGACVGKVPLDYLPRIALAYPLRPV